MALLRGSNSSKQQQGVMFKYGGLDSLSCWLRILGCVVCVVVAVVAVEWLLWLTEFGGVTNNGDFEIDEADQEQAFVSYSFAFPLVRRSKRPFKVNQDQTKADESRRGQMRAVRAGKGQQTRATRAVSQELTKPETRETKSAKGRQSPLRQASQASQTKSHTALFKVSNFIHTRSGLALPSSPRAPSSPFLLYTAHSRYQGFWFLRTSCWLEYFLRSCCGGVGGQGNRAGGGGTEGKEGKEGRLDKVKVGTKSEGHPDWEPGSPGSPPVQSAHDHAKPTHQSPILLMTRSYHRLIKGLSKGHPKIPLSSPKG
ncbi:hypothetical protein FPQ18DRAFT_420108 [Pyronema domesticum]|nr:hypothetical protein FPQ18DRAFT_420108 [Pyronema domesticum]